MQNFSKSRARLSFALVLIAAGVMLPAHRLDAQQPQTALENEVRADLGFLASDEMHGRGSATRDEHIAALYAAAQFKALGLEPAGDPGDYIQRVPVTLSDRALKRVEKFEATTRTETWNAIAILRGTDPKLKDEVILLTAHIDHLGMLKPATGDIIYNGADDDASGTAAVLAMAHSLATGPAPRRTIVFALFGSEELGGYGNGGFLKRPPVPLQSIVANLEFEMIGRPDAAVPPGTLWLTGFERSTLGPELAKHGARIVQDPHPDQHFFERSDNIALARQGIIAHTVSSFGLHKDYHQVSDEISTIDFAHMVRAIHSMEAPVRWLANSDFKPDWNPNGRPQPPAPRNP